MKIRKIVIPFITLLILVSQLTGCVPMSSHDALDEMHTNPEVVIEYGEVDHDKIELENGMVVDFEKSEVGEVEVESSILDYAYAEVENGMKQQEFESICNNAFDAVWTNDEVHGELTNHLAMEVDYLSIMMRDEGYSCTSEYVEAYKNWRNVAHPNPVPNFKFIDTGKKIYFTNKVNEIYTIPCLAHGEKRSVNAEAFAGKVASEAMVSENGLWVRFKYNGEYRYLPGDYCSFDSIDSTFENIANIGNIELFESSIGTVYATENVHMRENFNADSNSKGVLAKGQSITRLAIGKEDEAAEGWSKAVLSDGTIVYIKSEYLSTSRVASGSGNGNNSGNNVEAIPNKESDEKPTSNPPVNKPESSGPDPNTGNSDNSIEVPPTAPGSTQLTWEDLADGGEMEDMDGGNSDKPIDNSHLKNNG